MTRPNETATLGRNPPVVLDASRVERLQALATAAMTRSPDIADRLFQEIERATVVPAPDMPPNVVNIGSRVTFRDDESGHEQSIVLVLPLDADITERRVSVVTPIGVALIGLAQGASIDWMTRSGETRRLTVTSVEAAHVHEVAAAAVDGIPR
jgi:regulator of nucleoside diphosphate kinase